MTRFEELDLERGKLQQSIAIKRFMVVIGIVVTMTSIASAVASGATLLGIGLLFLVIAACTAEPILKRIDRKYQLQIDRLAVIAKDIDAIKKRINAVHERYERRQKGEQFKRAYALTGQTIDELELALAVGMLHERKEVFVTAFIRSGIAVRVTATIGSPFRCRPSDNPAHWKTWFERWGCDEIRQYHNHPAYHGVTSPSSTDIRSAKVFCDLMGKFGSQFRHFIIYWNAIREWKVLEYDKSGSHWVHCEFDTTTLIVRAAAR